MTTVERDPGFRERLINAYKIGDLGAADFAVSMTSQAPEKFLITRERCLSLLFCLELWAAFFGHPHPAIAHIKIDYLLWPRQRMSSNSDQAVTALFTLSQSPFGAEFAEDTHQLRPRLFAIAQRHDADDRRAAAQATGTEPRA
jgi:hypothetical protein